MEFPKLLVSSRSDVTASLVI